jgi:GH25 family lysozyme M1 (1,4-beta-N-acetylmuramidase)
MALLDVVIDVSDAQGTIHWDDVAAAGIKVAMIKATEGATFAAETWPANSAGAAAAGITVIPYHFMTNADPAAQADHFHKVAGLAPGAAYALDWEPRIANGVSITAGATQVDAMGQALQGFVGRTPLGYWGIPGSTPGAPTSFMTTWDRWVPRYRDGAVASFPGTHASPFGPPGGSPPDLPFLFWQYTQAGVVGGIGAPVDRSVASFDDANALIAWCTAAPGA